MPLQRGRDVQRRLQPAGAVLLAQELSDLQGLPVRIGKGWESHRGRSIKNRDWGKQVAWPFGRCVQFFKAFAQFLDGKYQGKFLSPQLFSHRASPALFTLAQVGPLNGVRIYPSA